MEHLKILDSGDIINELDNIDPEEGFIGFDVNDTGTIAEKIECIKVILDKEADISVDLDESFESPEFSPIAKTHTNYIEEENSSKSNISSPETIKNRNWGASEKKLNKDHSQADEMDLMECLESNFEHSGVVEICNKTRRSFGRKINIDMKNPMFKLPFEHGWRRELVFRSSGVSTLPNISADVYYYTPSNRKLRSLREIQKQLKLSSTESNPLTIDNFTFHKQAIGIKDKSKELIRNAKTKFSKNDSVAIEHKKAKSYNYTLSDNEMNKSSNIMNNKKLRTRSISIKDQNNSSSPLNISKDWQSIQSSTSPNTFPSQSDDMKNIMNNKRRLSTSDGEVIMQAPCGKLCPNSDVPATLMCAQCLVYYHPSCVKLNANKKVVNYVCINCRSSVRQKIKRLQPSFTVIGASESKQLCIEPICIQQVNQASDTFNAHKTEEHNNKFDDKNNTVINAVSCLESGYITTIVDDSFDQQNVNEVAQGSGLKDYVLKDTKNLEENSEINSSLRKTPDYMMQSFNHMVIAMRLIFKHLNIRELLTASQVCTTWNMIAMNKNLWQNVCFENVMVYDWVKCIEIVNAKCSVTMDTRRMIIPTELEECKHFWSCFSKAIKQAKELKSIELYKCPDHVVEDVIHSLPQLQVLHATSIKNIKKKTTKNDNNKNDIYESAISLDYLNQMTQLTEIKLKILSGGIQLLSMPSYNKLTNLKHLSLTSIKSFPNETYRSLDTLSTCLEVLEIGDCEFLTLDFAKTLKRFDNLICLRLEKCINNFKKIAKEVFNTIRKLRNLRILELINIEFSFSVENELEKCNHIKALLIIPNYSRQSSTTNRHLIDCIQKLSETFTHLIWGIPIELLFVTDLFIAQYQSCMNNMGCNLNMSDTHITSNNLPILKLRKLTPQSTKSTSKMVTEDSSDDVDIYSIQSLEKLLNSICKNAFIKVIKIPIALVTRVYIADQCKGIMRIMKNN